MTRSAQPPIGSYAAIGDGRTGALVGRDASIDWLCLPDFDGTPVLARILDAERGGRATLAPVDPHEIRRRYRPGTNVLETVMTTAGGELSVTDGMGDAAASVEAPPVLGRRVRCTAGRVRLAWSVSPRFGDGRTPPETVTPSPGGATFQGRGDSGAGPSDPVAVTVAAWGLGRPAGNGDAIGAQVELTAGD